MVFSWDIFQVPSRRINSPWNDEREALLQTMFFEGSSAAQIMTALNCPEITRNSVIGKLHRLRLTGPSCGAYVEVSEGKRGRISHRCGNTVQVTLASGEIVIHTLENVRILKRKAGRQMVVKKP